MTTCVCFSKLIKKVLLPLEIPSGKCAELHTMAASNNRDHPTRSFSSSPLASTINCSPGSQALLEVTHQDHSIGITLLLLVRATYTYFCSSRSSRSWWITQSTQHHRRGCNSTIAYIKCLPIKRVVSISQAKTIMLRAQTTTRTTGIPTQSGSLYPILVSWTQCNKWTKPDTLQFKWKNDHSRAIPLAAKYTLFFSDWKCTTCDVIFIDWVPKWQGVFVGKWL